jgi:hypothetical protein
MVGVVMDANALWTEVTLLEIQKFPPDLDGGEIEEVPNGLEFHLRQRTMEPNK